LLLIGGVTFLLVLIARFPAERLVPRIERQLADVSLQAVSGTVFSGQALRLTYRDIDLGPVHWQFRPVALLQGRVEYRLILSSPDNPLQTGFGITYSGRVYGRELTASLLPDRLLNHFSPVTIHSSGSLELKLESFELFADFPQAVAGRLAWEDGAILEPINLVLGQVVLDVQSVDNALVGTVVEPGALGLDGTLALTSDGRYRVDLLLQPGAEVSGEMLELLEMVARPRPAGDYRIEYAGQL
jgi:general secretion pathway protein N